MADFWLRVLEGVVVGIITGGLVSGVVVACVNNRFTKESREANFVREQLNRLYGPLQCHCSLYTANLELAEKFAKASSNVYSRVPRSERKDEDMRAVTERYQDYINSAHNNAFEMVRILASNYSYADPDDMATFRLFLGRCRRWENDHVEGGESSLDKRIWENMGSYAVCSEGFLQCIDRKFLAKQARLRDLGG